MGKGNYLNTKSRRYYGFLHPLMTFEYHCFGYKTAGNNSEEVVDHIEREYSQDTFNENLVHIKDTPKTKIIRHAFFYRHAEYASNPLFGILEFFMKLVSVIRVGLSKYALIGSFIVYIIMNTEGQEICDYLLTFFFACYGASLALALIGLICRKSFGLDQRTDDICEENQWKKWSEYKDK